MNAPSEIMVIRTRLPYIDHRALSQAWYAALRLGAGAGPAVPMFQRRAVSVVTEPRHLQRASPTSTTVQIQPPSNAMQRKPAQPSQRIQPSCQFASVQRTSRTEHSPRQQISKPSPSHAAAFTLTLGEARVRIVVRGEGNRLALTAVCSTRHAELVRLALAHASLGLRMYGALVDTTLHCEDSAHD